MSIKKTLQIWLITITLIPLLTLSVVSYLVITDKVLELHEGHIEQLIRTNSSSLETIIVEQKDELINLTKRPEILNLLRLEKLSDDSNYFVNNLFQLKKDAKSYCKEISLSTINKTIISSTNNSKIGTTETKQELIHKLSSQDDTDYKIGTPYKVVDELGKEVLYMDIGSPVLDQNNNNQIIGYIVYTVSLSYFDMYLEYFNIDSTGVGFILDQNGTLLYSSNESDKGVRISSDKLASIYTDYTQGKLNHFDSFTYEDNEGKHLCTYKIIPEYQWVMLINQDYNEINNISYLILFSILIATLITIVILNIVIEIFSHKFTDPILHLRDTMKKASNGDLSVQTNIKANNELGELSKSFNKMLHIIKTNYDDLTSMHEELLTNEEQLRNNFEHIEYLAYHDILTSLPNKLAFLEQANSILGSQKGKKEMHAILFVDLDNFKSVNDTLGHEYGDILLAKTASLLRSIIRCEDMLARAGGDEFLIFLHNIKDKEYPERVSADILQALKEPIQINDELLYVSMSIGISIYPDNGVNTTQLIKFADIAMYHSKDTGKNKASVFNRMMEEKLNRNSIILEIIRGAIPNREVYMVYQPQYDIKTNKIIGYEALMRIKSAKYGLISPLEFIPVAEESGMIVELGEWALLEACQFNKELLDQGICRCPISVNISCIQLNHMNFIHTLHSVLERTGLPPELLELEITESTLVSTIVDAQQLFTRIVQLGIRISLDDFGTGYSSLNYLTRIPINTLKMDKSFIDNICCKPKDCFIAESIIRLAHDIDIKVIAEGVENEEQLGLLIEKHCDMVQGYIYSKPLEQEQFVDILMKQK